MSDPILIDIKVNPRSSREKAVLEQDGTLKVYLTAPPVDGKANQALLKFVSKKTGVPKSSIIIVKGEVARHKTLSLPGTTREELIEKITS